VKIGRSETQRIERKGVERLKEQIEAALTKIRPGLLMDGGDIELVGVEDGVVKVRLKGACAGCPASTMTLRLSVEETLKREVPGVTRVVAVP
jgi:Fe-S cluster biogenesis protein NfuA